MNLIPVMEYILSRTKEPSIVHRMVQAVGGLVAAWALTGPERWIGVILSVSALIGILMPDTRTSGWNDASQIEKTGVSGPADAAQDGVQPLQASPTGAVRYQSECHLVDHFSGGWSDR